MPEWANQPEGTERVHTYQGTGKGDTNCYKRTLRVIEGKWVQVNKEVVTCPIWVKSPNKSDGRRYINIGGVWYYL